jgi:hypothetical protein
MYFGASERCVPEFGRQEGVSRISLCSRAHRVTGVASSAKRAVRRSVTVARAVAALGLEGMKKTLGLVS